MSSTIIKLLKALNKLKLKLNESFKVGLMRFKNEATYFDGNWSQNILLFNLTKSRTIEFNSRFNTIIIISSILIALIYE